MRDCGLVSSFLVSKIINIGQLLTANNYNIFAGDTDNISFASSIVSIFLTNSIDLVDIVVQRGIKTKYFSVPVPSSFAAPVDNNTSGVLIDDLEVIFKLDYLNRIQSAYFFSFIFR